MRMHVRFVSFKNSIYPPIYHLSNEMIYFFAGDFRIDEVSKFQCRNLERCNRDEKKIKSTYLLKHWQTSKHVWAVVTSTRWYYFHDYDIFNVSKLFIISNVFSTASKVSTPKSK